MIRNSLLYIAIAVLAIFHTIFPKVSSAAELISDYQVDIKINKDSSVNITEKIQYDFGSEQRHGIFRKIPFTTANQEGKKYKLDIKVDAVKYGDNKSVPYTRSTENENIVLKIGDPNKTLSGVNTYQISYTVNGAVTYFSDHDELYWNAIGTDWQIPISHGKVNIDLSDLAGVNLDPTKVICFTGAQGSKTQNCSSTISSGNKVSIVSDVLLRPGEGLTFAVSLPKNILEVHEPSEYDPGKGALIIFLLFFLANLILSVGIVALWFFKGRDPKDDRVIVRMYDAPKDTLGNEMTPLELGTIFDENISSKDLSGEIINLAIQKYLIIEEDEKKSVKLRRGPELQKNLLMLGLKPHQQDLIRAFDLDIKDEVSLSAKTITNSRAIKIAKIKANVYKSLTGQGYFKGNPQNIRMKYFAVAFILLFIGMIVPGILVGVFAYFMPSKTTLGVEAKRHALGLKQFLDSQDRQFEFQEKNFYLFEKLLPYAIAFNVAKVWAKKFEDLYDYRPEWYQSNNLNSFTTYNIVNSLESDLGRVESNYSSPTSSSTGHSSGFSGGGSSGGGGGGGGGGSW